MAADLRNGLVCKLARDDAKRVFAARDNETLQDTIKQIAFEGDGKAPIDCQGRWSALHDVLKAAGSAQTELSPLEQCVSGGRQLQREPGLLVSVVRPDMVPAVSAALQQLTGAEFAACAERLNLAYADELKSVYQAMTKLFAEAANERCAVVFAAIP